MKKKGNPVAKYMNKYNKATVQTDRKKDAKRGYVKHKGAVVEKQFEPHMMYDPKSGKGVEAKTHQQHLDLKKKGYGHDKPEVEETYRASMASRAAANKMYGRQHPEQDKPKTGVTKKATPGLDSKGRMVKDKNPATTRASSRSLAKSIAKKYGKNESTDAYAKSQAAIRDKKKRAGITTSDQKKIGAVADMMRKEREKRANQNEEVETNSAAKKAIFVTNPTTGKRETKMEPTHRKKLDKMHKDHDAMHEGVEECWDTHKKVGTKMKDGKLVNDCRPKSEGLALPGYPEQEKLKIVDPFKKVDVKEEIEEVDEFLRVKTNPAFSARTTSSGDRKSNNKQKQSSQSISTTSGNGYKVSRNIKTGQTTKSRTNVGGRTSQKESTISNIKISEATSQKLLNKMKELSPKGLPRSSVELRKLKARAKDELRDARAAKRNAPKPKVTSKTAKGNIRTGNKGSDERNIIMQLRKAQDLDGKFDISVSPKQGRTVRIGKNQIDALLRNYNKLQKPDQKRAFVIQVTRALRQKSK